MLEERPKGERDRKKRGKTNWKRGKKKRENFIIRFCDFTWCWTLSGVVCVCALYFLLLTLWYLDPLPLIFACIFKCNLLQARTLLLFTLRFYFYLLSLYAYIHTHSTNRAIFSLWNFGIFTHSASNVWMR